MTMNASPWTAERVEMLRTMAAEGKSCGIIADALVESGFTNCTRNAVLGKAFRDGITIMRYPLLHLDRGGTGEITPRRLGEKQSRRKPHKIPRMHKKVGWFDYTWWHKSAKRSPPQFVTPSKITPLNIPYLELKEHHCRYLLEERGEDGLKLSCGHQVMEGHSWCFGHAYAIYKDFVCYREAAE